MYRLRRVLRGIGWLYPDLGYCQGVGVIGAILLLLLEEEDAFWLLSAIVEDLLPASYYTPSLIGTIPLYGINSSFSMTFVFLIELLMCWVLQVCRQINVSYANF